jgi:preprotein translocase subunit SecE
MTTQQPVEQKAPSTAAPIDTLLLLLAFAAVVGGIAGFYLLDGQFPAAARLALVLVSLGVGAALAYQTAAGRSMWGYIRGSQVELRKTTWPTRQESLQATLMIAAVVAFFALMVWLLDSGLLWAVQKVTEQG